MKKVFFTLFLFGSVLASSAQRVVQYTFELPADLCEGTLYVNLEMEQELRVYPNPVVDILNVPVLLAGDERATVLLLDANGKLLQQKTVADNDVRCQLFMSNYPAGIYFVQVMDAKKTTYKIIKN